jgi:hypothetical protein
MKNGIFLDEILDSFTVVPYLVASWKHVIRRAGDVRAYLYRCPIRTASAVKLMFGESPTANTPLAPAHTSPSGNIFVVVPNRDRRLGDKSSQR